MSKIHFKYSSFPANEKKRPSNCRRAVFSPMIWFLIFHFHQIKWISYNQYIYIKVSSFSKKKKNVIIDIVTWIFSNVIDDLSEWTGADGGTGGGESLRGFCRTHGSVKWRRRMRESESDGGDGGVVPEMSQEYTAETRTCTLAAGNPTGTLHHGLTPSRMLPDGWI